MKIAYYPGCSLHSTGIEFDMSIKEVCRELDVQLDELEGWICCGSSPAHQSNELMAAAMPAKNLVLTKQLNAKKVCAPCASCYSRLKFAQTSIQDEALRKDIEYVIDDKVPDDIEVLNMIDLITQEVGLEAVRQKVQKPLDDIRVACYYGCLTTRPPRVTGKDNFENPTDMESVIKAIGAKPIDWNLKTFCCGASFAMTQTHVVLDLCKKLLDDATAAGANVIAAACPLCQFNLDSRQKQINEKYGTDFNIPIFYFTQLMGLAFGVDAGKLGIHKHITEVDDFLKERALI